MFVQKNDMASVRAYFSEQLKDQFSSSEIKLITKAFVRQRLELTDSEYLLANDLKFSESDLLFFRSCVKRLQQNEPFQYVHGFTEFFGLELKCDARALIPRPETEELVSWIVETAGNQPKLTVADVCSGSGCIALALKSALVDAKIEAWELSEDALALIKENADFTGLQIQITKLDALAVKYPIKDESYDIWVSNPPYVPILDKDRMEQNVLEFEPHMALFVEDDNRFVFYENIACSAQTGLVAGGWLYFEIHEDYAHDMCDLMKRYAFVNIEVRKDLQGKQRMMRGQKVLSHYEQK